MLQEMSPVAVHGFVAPGFEPVQAAFEENFTKRDELGGAVSVYLRGEKVVDLWGGVRDPATGDPWEEDTMVVVYSLTKGMAAMTLALAHSRGLIEYDARVADYWPEFAQNGKEAITVRHLLSHQAGLHAFHEKVDKAVIADLDRLADIMARERPAWPPGTRNAYHFISLGFYKGELIRRVDPDRRTLGRFFQEEIATPLGIDFFIRVPEEIPNSRLARLKQAGMVGSIIALPPKMALSMLNPWSHPFRACMVNPGGGVIYDEERVYARNLEIPSGGGVGTARAIARAYGAFATGGAEIGIAAETLAALKAPASPPSRGFYDEVVMGEAKYSLGFMKPNTGFTFGPSTAFGHPGAGGSLGFADPEKGLGYGYVTNRIAGGIVEDPRDVALRAAIASVL